MKKWKLFSAISALSLLLIACSTDNKTVSNSSATSSAAEPELTVIKVATPGTLFPTSYYNEEKQLVGYEVDMMNEIGKRLNVKIEYSEMGVDTMLSSVQNGTVDVAMNSFDATKERQERFALSEPYKYSVGGIMVRADGSSNITTLEEFQGKKAGGGANTQSMKIAEKLGAELVVYDNSTNDVYLRDVANGRTDFIPNDYYTMQIAVKRFSDIPVKVQENLLYNPTQNVLVLKKENAALRDKLSQVITEMKNDGTLKAISEKYYLGQDLSVPLENTADIPVIEVE